MGDGPGTRACPPRDTAQHLLFHHEMRDVEHEVAGRAAVAAGQQSGGPEFLPERESPRSRGFFAASETLEVGGGHQYQVRVGLHCGHDLAGRWTIPAGQPDRVPDVHVLPFGMDGIGVVNVAPTARSSSE